MLKPMLFLATCLVAVTPAAGQGNDSDPAARFGAREGIEHIDISPDGRRVLYLAPGPGASTMLAVQDLSGSAAPQIAVRSDGNPERLRWCQFVTDDRVVCEFGALVADGASLVPFSRLIAMDTDGSDAQLLGQRQSFFDAYLRQFDGSILDWMPGANGAVLMSRQYVPEAGRMGTRLSRQTEGLGVDRVDVRTGRSSTVEPANPRAGRYLTDGRGQVRIMAIPEVRGGATGQLGTRTDYMFRRQGGTDWERLGSYDGATREGIFPLAVDPTLDSAYVLKKLDGRFALYRMKLDGSGALELAHANPQVDVDGVVRAGRGSQVIGATFADESRRTIYFDRTFEGLARALGEAMPNLPLIDFVSSSHDGNKLLIHAGSDSDPGRYFVFDRAASNLNEILLDRPELENVALANVRAVTYPAADGAIIPGYLTLPPGQEGRGLPAVILPHGGPEARDEWGFDWLAQYLAHRGYAVLQPNFRGSDGYGDAWLAENGFRGWRTSIGDINSGARWLVAQGIADPQRLAILGWSYGGYAALQAGATEPDLYKAVVAIAPVTDLQMLKADWQGFRNARNIAEYVGTGPHVEEGSPAHQAARIAAPVLLFHGDRDFNVRVHQSQRMHRALQSAGKNSELTIFPGLEHDLADSAARTRMLRRIGEFLQARTGR